MIALWIILGILAALLLTLLLLLLLGGAGIRIAYGEELRITLLAFGISIPLVSPEKKAKKKPPLKVCRNPEGVLKKERRRRKKEEKRAERARLKAQKKAARKKKAPAASHPTPSPNLSENLDMIRALLARLYEKTKGRIRIHVRALHVRVGSDDAAKTAILYGAILQSASLLLSFIESTFTHVSRTEGSMTVEADFSARRLTAEIDIEVTARLRHLLGTALALLFSYQSEHGKPLGKAQARVNAAQNTSSTL